MNDQHEPTPPDLPDVVDEVLVGELLEAHEPTEIERRFAELEDPDGPTFVSPLGDRRERPVPCQRCRREKTFALGGVCVPCLKSAAGLERLLELSPALEELRDRIGRALCSGQPYPVNPDVPEEGSDLRHDGPCAAHPDDELSYSATTYPARRSSASGKDVVLPPAWAR